MPLQKRFGLLILNLLDINQILDFARKIIAQTDQDMSLDFRDLIAYPTANRTRRNTDRSGNR